MFVGGMEAQRLSDCNEESHGFPEAAPGHGPGSRDPGPQLVPRPPPYPPPEHLRKKFDSFAWGVAGRACDLGPPPPPPAFWKVMQAPGTTSVPRPVREKAMPAPFKATARSFTTKAQFTLAGSVFGSDDSAAASVPHCAATFNSPVASAESVAHRAILRELPVAPCGYKNDAAAQLWMFVE